MEPTQVEKINTKWTLEGLVSAFYEACINANLGIPSPEALATLAAQSTIECGHGGPGCWNYNVSNIMGVSPEGLYHVLKAPECAKPENVPKGATVLSSTNVACPPGHVAYIPPGGSKFRAYSSLANGCTDKIETLKRIWPVAIKSLIAPGNITMVSHSYVDGLVTPRYFTSDIPTYKSTVSSIAEGFLDEARVIVNNGGQVPEIWIKDHKDIVSWQRALIKLGYDIGDADGVVGPKTTQAVKDFQTKSGLVSDGKVGPKTIEALNKAL